MVPPTHLPRATGCSDCGESGYRNRFALFETAHGSFDAPEPFCAGSLGAAGLEQVAAQRTTLVEVLTHCPQPTQASAS